MKTHILKCWPAPFAEVEGGMKTVEVRRCDDRTFEKGDHLLLEEWDPEKNERERLSADEEEAGYTGRSVLALVLHVTTSAGDLELRGSGPIPSTTCHELVPLAALSIRVMR